MAYDKRADCANSQTSAKVDPSLTPGTVVDVICTRCKQWTYATVQSGERGWAGYYVHLRPGKTLADRR